MSAPKQWQCGHCAAWVDAAWWRHQHVIEKTPTFEQMLFEREKYGDQPRILGAATLHTYSRTGDEPTRDKPI